MLAAERHAKHAQEYQTERHRPEETVLYRTVSTHWSEFRGRLEGVGSLPKFVLRDVDEYLRCGILEHGFIRVAKRLFGLSSVDDGHTGMVTVIQRFDSALRLNVHLPCVTLRSRCAGAYAYVCSQVDENRRHPTRATSTGDASAYIVDENTNR